MLSSVSHAIYAMGSSPTNTSSFGRTSNLTIPGGTYDNQTFPIPIVDDNNAIEDNETVTFTAQPVRQAPSP